MTKRNTQLYALLPSLWSLGVFAIALFVLLPVVTILWLAFFPTDNIWPHLSATVLPRYIGNTVFLLVIVGTLTAFFGTGAAWVVVMYRFPSRRFFEYALLFPLAIPAYIGAYSLVDFLQYAGPVQSGLRSFMGWQSARDYWFPEIRSPLMAAIVLSAAFYPYVYLLARAAFKEQSASIYDVARVLGASPWRVFWRIGLPLARPAIAAGVALALMETVADFGTVAYFNVQTLTTGVFTVWLDKGNIGGAAQIASLSLVVIILLRGIESIGRRKSRYARQSQTAAKPPQTAALYGVAAFAATAFCALPFVIGFALPFGVILFHAAGQSAAWAAPALISAVKHSLVTGIAAALITLIAALFLGYGARVLNNALAQKLLPLTSLGYAMPGAVLALGILIPLANLDHSLADSIAKLTGEDPGLILTGSAAALILAYSLRFFGVAKDAIDSAFGRIPPNLPSAARSLGHSPSKTLRAIHIPLIRGSILSAALIVFVDCIKELPATLLLRPFNYNTLATHLYEKASLEQLAQAAPAALLIISIGLCAVILLARKFNRLFISSNAR